MDFNVQNYSETFETYLVTLLGLLLGIADSVSEDTGADCGDQEGCADQDQRDDGESEVLNHGRVVVRRSR